MDIMDKLAVGIDLGGTNITAALLSEDGRIVQSVSRRTNPERGSGPVIEDMAEMVEELIRRQSVSRDDIVGLGIGAPGPLSHRDGIIYKAANLPGWQGVRIRRGLLERTGLPTVLENDANAAAFAEYWVGAGKGTRELVVLTLGTGLGSGVVIGGEILRGHFENAGELGHMIVQHGGRQCECGQRGCLEVYASPGNVAKQAIRRLKEGEESSMREVYERDGRFGSRVIAEHARAGDKLANELWDEACYYIAVGIINCQHAFNPPMLVLAGGMTKSGDFLLSRVQKYMQELTWKLLDDLPEVTISILGNTAGVIGAGGVAWAARNNGTLG